MPNPATFTDRRNVCRMICVVVVVVVGKSSSSADVAANPLAALKKITMPDNKTGEQAPFLMETRIPYSQRPSDRLSISFSFWVAEHFIRPFSEPGKCFIDGLSNPIGTAALQCEWGVGAPPLTHTHSRQVTSQLPSSLFSSSSEVAVLRGHPRENVTILYRAQYGPRLRF